MDTALVAMIAGSGWASGVNLYAVLALLGLLGRAGLGTVPEGLLRTDVIIVALVMFALEFVADKIPWLDSVWDALHTVVRPIGAVVLGAVLAGDTEGWHQLTAALGSGGLATTSHVAKATTRLAINGSPEPVTNVGVSLAEDGLVAGVVWLALTNPVLAIALVTALLLAGIVLTVTLVRVARRTLRARRSRRERGRRTSGRGGPPPGA